MIITLYKKLVFGIAACISFTTMHAMVTTISSDFAFVLAVNSPCVITQGSTFQVVYTMKNAGPATIFLQTVGTFLFPNVYTLNDLAGAQLVSFVADDGTEFIDAPGLKFGRWQLTQASLAPGETKQLTLTLQALSPAQEVVFYGQAQTNNTSSTSSQEIVVSIGAIAPCPVSTGTATIAGLFSEDNLPVTITSPTTVFYNEPFNIIYSITNSATFGISVLWFNVFPTLVDSSGNTLFEVISTQASPSGGTVSPTLSALQASFYPTGKGQGFWQTSQTVLLPPGETATLTITLQPTTNAPALLAYITLLDGNPSTTFGPVQVQVTAPPVAPPGDETCPILTDPVARALASLLPAETVGGF